MWASRFLIFSHTVVHVHILYVVSLWRRHGQLRCLRAPLVLIVLNRASCCSLIYRRHNVHSSARQETCSRSWSMSLRSYGHIWKRNPIIFLSLGIELWIFPILSVSSISLEHLKVLRFIFPTEALSESLHQKLFRLYRFLIRVFVTRIVMAGVVCHIMKWALLFDELFNGDNIKKWICLYRRADLGHRLIVRLLLLPKVSIELAPASFNFLSETSSLEISHSILLLLKHIFLYFFFIC